VRQPGGGRCGSPRRAAVFALDMWLWRPILVRLGRRRGLRAAELGAFTGRCWL